jgi:hypothetical protein
MSGARSGGYASGKQAIERVGTCQDRQEEPLDAARHVTDVGHAQGRYGQAE